MTVILRTIRQPGDKLLVRGMTSDNGAVKKVTVNGKEARSLDDNFGDWEVVLESLKAGPVKLTARAEDAAGNVEKRPHGVYTDR